MGGLQRLRSMDALLGSTMEFKDLRLGESHSLLGDSFIHGITGRYNFFRAYGVTEIPIHSYADAIC